MDTAIYFEQDKASYTLWQITRYFLRLGTIGFGGPVALVGYMHRDLVEKNQWITEDDYREGLAGAQMAVVQWILEKRQPHTAQTLAQTFHRLQRAAIRDAFGIRDDG